MGTRAFKNLLIEYAASHTHPINILIHKTFVPLIMRFPKRMLEQPLRLENTVSIADIFPTVFGRLAIDSLRASSDRMTGEDVLSGRYDRGFAITQEATEFAKGETRPEKYGLLTERGKLLRMENKDLLFDLEGEGEGTDVTPRSSPS